MSTTASRFFGVHDGSWVQQCLPAFLHETRLVLIAIILTRQPGQNCTPGKAAETGVQTSWAARAMQHSNPGSIGLRKIPKWDGQKGSWNEPNDERSQLPGRNHPVIKFIWHWGKIQNNPRISRRRSKNIPNSIPKPNLALAQARRQFCRHLLLQASAHLCTELCYSRKATF